MPILDSIASAIKTHLFYVLLIGGGLIGFHSWLAEHDARLQADSTIKTAQIQVTDLQQQITAAKQAAAQKVVVIQKEKATVKDTPTALPVINAFDPALMAKAVVESPTTVQVESVPLAQDLENAKIDGVNLAACQVELAGWVSTSDQKDIEIAALKKKPSFWKRFSGTAKAVGIGVGIGMVLAGHI